jgi:hypothetical protein
MTISVTMHLVAVASQSIEWLVTSKILQLRQAMHLRLALGSAPLSLVDTVLVISSEAIKVIAARTRKRLEMIMMI